MLTTINPGQEQRLLQEQLARLRDSWRHENHQQNQHAANEVSTAGGLAAAPSLNGVVDRNQQLLIREHHSYQQQLRELEHGSPHQQRYYPPAMPPGPSLTPAPVIMCAASTRVSPSKRSAPPPPCQAPRKPLGKRPCLATPSSSRPCREQWELLVELGRRQAGSQLEQRNAEIQLNQMWQADPLAFAESFAGSSAKAKKSPSWHRLFLAPAPAVSMITTRPDRSILKERFAQHVMCRYTPKRPSEFQLSLWVSSRRLINLLQPHAPTEVLQLGPQKLTQLIIEWYKDHPAYKDLAFSSWCRHLRLPPSPTLTPAIVAPSAPALVSAHKPWPQSSPIVALGPCPRVTLQ